MFQYNKVIFSDKAKDISEHQQQGNKIYENINGIILHEASLGNKTATIPLYNFTIEEVDYIEELIAKGTDSAKKPSDPNFQSCFLFVDVLETAGYDVVVTEKDYLNLENITIKNRQLQISWDK